MLEDLTVGEILPEAEHIRGISLSMAVRFRL